MADVYRGPGLKGMPRGTVKSLRVFTYHFGYQRIAGIDHRVGTDGPWEVKRILGTVPVEADGSALFRVPAKTPISVQPLDAEGKAVQLMRSWMTAMPGETLSCVGCHEQPQHARRRPRPRWPLQRRPPEIEPWYGPPRTSASARGAAGARQVLRRLPRRPAAAGRHDDSPTSAATRARTSCFRGGDPRAAASSRGAPPEKLVGKYGGIFEPSYVALRSLVRVAGLGERPAPAAADGVPRRHERTGPDAQARATTACSSTREAWDRLITWIDLNAPCHGTWGEFVAHPAATSAQRRLRTAASSTAASAEDGEADPPRTAARRLPTPDRAQAPARRPQAAARPALPGWPFDAAEAQRRQAARGPRDAHASTWAAA